VLPGAERLPRHRGWDNLVLRWNPWSPDGSHITFLRDNQVWMSDPDGQQARQLTFDRRPKCKPTFSPSGRRIAYLARLADNIDNPELVFPHELWVVDIETTLAARLIIPDDRQINCVDWLDDATLIVDRVNTTKLFGEGPSLSLWKVQLK